MNSKFAQPETQTGGAVYADGAMPEAKSQLAVRPEYVQMGQDFDYLITEINKTV